MKKHLLTIILPALLVLSCSSIEELSQKTYSGKYRLDSGVGIFYPDDTNEKWLVESGIINDHEKNICFKDVKFKGQVSKTENFGYDKNYSRSFTITEVIKITRVDCKDFNK